MTTRAKAAAALGRILRGGAYSNVLLGHGGSERTSDERRFVQGIVMHALRTVGLADEVIALHSKRPIGRLDQGVVDVLRIAIAELDRGGTPTPIIVSEAVEAAKASGAGRATGFVNGLLRSLARSGLPTLPTKQRLGVPAWLGDTMDEAWGVAEADEFWKASAAPARVGLRGDLPTNTEVTPVDGIAHAYLSDRPIPGVAVQDPASTAVAQAVGSRPGELVLDMAGAPGGKTAVLLEDVGDEGRVIAGDLHARRLRTARERVPGASWVRMDAAQPPFAAHAFDRVLLDAPCTGLGTLRRRPEILLRVTEEESTRLAGVQARALEAALRSVKPGGTVVYSVCTVLPAETVAQIAHLEEVHPPDLPFGRREGQGWLLAPHLGPTDGMFIAILRR